MMLKWIKNIRKFQIILLRSSLSSYPKYTNVTLPALSPTMETGTIISWEKKEGEKLNEGDLLAEIETDKATMGLETPEEGYLAKIVIPAGTRDVPIGKLVCVIVENSNDVAAFNNFTTPSTDDTIKILPTTSLKNIEMKIEINQIKSNISKNLQKSNEEKKPIEIRQFISPLAKILASNRGIDLNTITGTGYGGSIKSNDLKMIEINEVKNYQILPISNIRTVIAKRLQMSKQTIPHYYVTSIIPMDNIIKLRQDFNQDLSSNGIKLSLNDFIIKASATACYKIKEVNSHWMEDSIREYSSVDISIAVDTPRGLITPIIFDANRKGLIEISNEMKNLANKAKNGKLKPNEYQGGTFSISNLGMYGINHFTAIINPPQSCILAIGAITNYLIKDNEGIKEKQQMSVTLSCDHRVVDGAIAAKWLQNFKQFLINPAVILL